MKVTIFFSWQTTTEVKYNRRFIYTCIEKSIKKLKLKPEFKEINFDLQEGITGEAGSVKVASKIVDDRIPKCDIFIADLSVVNSMSKLAKRVMNFLGTNYKPFQNNNVIYEYGVAYDSIGEQKIIAVLNKTYGSPNDNPSNIPFDLSHLRYPIEYEFSKTKDNKQAAESDLINSLTKALKDTTLFALQNQKDKYKPLIVWSELEKLIPTSQEFRINDKIIQVISLLKDGMTKPFESIRLIGLSGLGKTRILLEAFRVKENDEQSIILNSRVLYVNYNNYPNADYHSIITNLQSTKEDRIIVIDNCTKSLHRSLIPLINREKNALSLISIDSNPEEIEQDKINGVNYILIKKEDLSSIVGEILENQIDILGRENIDKIKEFSQGIPMMAVLIAESVEKGERFIGKLEDKDLLDKLLGAKGQDERARTILKSCSIFNYFGIRDELRPQLEFIATNKDLTSLTGDNQVIINEFEETCHHFLKREIFEKKGRLIGLRPFPLALSLAQEWLEPCSPARLLRVLEAIGNLPNEDKKSLSDALSEQMKYLGYNDNAVFIIGKIVGAGSPFDNTEVLNTELGSRLFRSFVEVNPVAISKNFVRNFLNRSTKELLEIKEGRRNIIWVLEKLCFDKRTFDESARILYSFAIAENETWSNNATGQLLHLFKIVLPGTEADLESRWKIINWGLNNKNNNFYDLALKAMNSGLSYGHFGRSGGAENQGVRKLNDFRPNTQEIGTYWSKIYEKLEEISLSESQFAGEANNILANNIRGAFSAGFSELIIPVLERIAEFRKNDWDDGLDNLKSALKYEKRNLSDEMSSLAGSLINKLTKTDFRSRYLNMVSNYYNDNIRVGSHENLLLKISDLANEFANSDSKKEYIRFLMSSFQEYSFHFGKYLYNSLSKNEDNVDEFINWSLDELKSIPLKERNLTVLGGFISNSSEKIKEDFYRLLEKTNDFEYLLFYFLSVDNNGIKYFDILFSLLDSGKFGVEEFTNFKYSNAFSSLSIDNLQSVSEKIFRYGNKGYIIIFDILFNISYGDIALRVALVPIFKKCILKLGINKRANREIDHFKWTETMTFLLNEEHEDEFAIYVNHSILQSIKEDNSYHLDHDIQKIYKILLIEHFDAIWPELSETLLSENENYIVFYELKNILGSHIGGYGNNLGILFFGDIEKIFEWCRLNSPLAPTRLAELVPIFAGNNDDYSSISQTAQRLIDEFGEIETVLDHLSSNMGTYSWVGTVIPLLEAKLKIFKNLLSHPKPEVSEWANRYVNYTELNIKRERDRDEEMFL